MLDRDIQTDGQTLFNGIYSIARVNTILRRSLPIFDRYCALLYLTLRLYYTTVLVNGLSDSEFTSLYIVVQVTLVEKTADHW